VDHGLREEGKNGLGLVRLLRKKFPQAKIIMLSNYSDFQYKALALKNGADDFLLKLSYRPAILADYLKFLLKPRSSPSLTRR
jgi:two-component system response regulator YesN